MSVFTRQTRVRAPLESVWEFHSDIEGLVALTPAFLGLRVERVVDRDGEPTDRLDPGTRVSLSVRLFQIGPRRGWTSVILERTKEPGAAVFVDEMQNGPFSRWRHRGAKLLGQPDVVWRHTHAFYADGEETLIRDRVEYELPRGLDRLGWLGLEPMFRYRHRRTKAELE